jgi:CPA2 family monovalent cation:H+ antiporter-2
MEETTPQILEIGLLLLGAVAAGWVARRIGLPAIVGYLVLGIAVSPFTPGFVAERHQLALFADVGVVLLLFEVGIEIDIATLRREQGALLAVAPIQVILTTAVAGAAFALAGLGVVAALTIGLCVAMSSSIVVVNITRSRRRVPDPATELALLGWSVLQDLTGVALAAVLLGALGGEGRSVALALGGLVAFGVVAVVVARIVPTILHGLREEHDLLLIASVATGLALAGAGAYAFGVPLALAAFVGGLAISEDPDAAEVRTRLLPFRDLFAVLFFIALGSLIDPAAIGGGLGWLALVLGLIVVAKVGVAYVLARFASLEVRPLRLAVGLGQIGEFSFVLASAALAAGVIPNELFVAIVVAVTVSIAASSVAARAPALGPAQAAA